MGKVWIRYRNTDDAGLTEEEISVDEARNGGLRYLKTHVMNALRQSWGPGVLQLENILVFRVSDDVSKITQDSDIDWNESGDKEFVAMEYFTTVPTALFRTVRNDELAYLTFSHPAQVEDSTWTKMSPLHCAAFRGKKKGLKDETSLPWLNMKVNNKKKEFVVHGVSLFCSDNAEETVVGSFDPFTEPDPGEEKTGVRRMSLGNAFGIPEDDLEGILFSRYTHDKAVEGQPFKSHKYKYGDPKERKKNGMATQRESYLRFKLKEGLDLAPYGVAVVYDNNTKLHFSLVLSREQWDPLAKWTAAGDSLELHLPNDAWPLYTTIERNDETRNQFLLNHVLKTDGDRGDHEPENCITAHRDYRYLPKVAALFSLHDLKLEAKVEPQELSPGDKHYQIYEASMVLFHSDLPWDVYLAIVALENADYSLERITPSERNTLQEAIAEIDGDFESAVDSLEWEYTHVANVIDAMNEQLRTLQDKISLEGHPTTLRDPFELESS